MNADQRRAKIAAVLADCPDASSRSIAKAVGCSQASVVRDLAFLRGDSVIHLAVNQSEPQDIPQVSESQRLVAALDAELAESAIRNDRPHLAWSAAEADVIAMIAARVDRRVELSAQYAACDNTNVKLKIATELRLTEDAIARLYKQVSAEVPGPQSATSMKASRAARSRWDRERMRQEHNHAN
jgi:hypothetical protein